jgi:rhombotail lipoprotein
MKSHKLSLFRVLWLVGVVTVVAAGCAHTRREAASSSLVDFLYPKGELPPAYEATLPNLPLPLNVGIAFVPGSKPGSLLSEAKKNELLVKAKLAFQDRPFIGQIVVVPDVYMRSGRGFGTVDQIARLFNLDVIALVSYDQVSNSDHTGLSVLYWTIVGAYVIPGNRHEVRTFVDTAVFDVRTHKLLFRAPGVAANTGHSTLVGEQARRREVVQEGFELAMADMVTNLDKEIDSFKDRIKRDKTVTVSHRPGYTGGGGAVDPWLIALLVPLVWLARQARQ